MRSTLTAAISTLLLTTTAASAQQTIVSDPHIQTVTVRSTDSRTTVPVIELNATDSIVITFDELSHDYQRFSYTIEHCDALWQPSPLSPLDYVSGFAADNLIEPADYSMNTTTDYTHYSFSLPNEQTRMKLSGNYRVSVYSDDYTSTPAFSVCFRVAEPLVPVTAGVSTDTDVDHNATHQQLTLSLATDALTLRNPLQELSVQVQQNGRTDNLVSDISPTHIAASELRYEHLPSLIFDAGNEFRRFETVTIKQPGMHVDKVRYFTPFYHATLFTDAPRTDNYSYDQDQNGRFSIRADRTDSPDTEADYLFVHFHLESPKLSGADVYLHGDLTNYAIDEQSRMSYNNLTGCYETVRLLKQGSYNYQYVSSADGHKLSTALTEGNHYEAENTYTVYVYYRPVGERYDRLVGVQQVSTTHTSSR
jgi:hypothetical protein